MNRVSSAAFGLALCVLFTAGSASASIPSPVNFVCPGRIALVGSAAGVTDGDGDFTVIARDLANVPIHNSLIVVDFSGCSGITLCSASDPGLTVDCATRTVRGFTDWNGTIHFRVRGHTTTRCDDGPRHGRNCAKVYADGVFLCYPDVAIYDLDGNGMGPSDLSAWLCDFFGTHNPARSDYDASGQLGPADLSLWLDVFFDMAGNGASWDNCPISGEGECPMVP